MFLIHILTLNEISKFSPPHMSRPGSYFPIFMKYFLSIANSPPAMVGDLQQVIHELENVFRIEMFVLGFRNSPFKHLFSSCDLDLDQKIQMCENC